MTLRKYCTNITVSVHPSLTLQSISLEIFSMTLFQSFSWPPILLSSSCNMLLSCSVMLSNCMRLTLPSRARLSAFWRAKRWCPPIDSDCGGPMGTTEKSWWTWNIYEWYKKNNSQFQSSSPPVPCQLSFHPVLRTSCTDAGKATIKSMCFIQEVNHI